MKNLIVLLFIFLLCGCNTVISVQIPREDGSNIIVDYSYPMWQEKYFTWDINKDGNIKVTFQSKSDPLVQALKTVESLSDTINAMNPKTLP
jgi:uncharacterized protein YceK